MVILGSAVDALRMAFAMFWEILWALILGVFLSAVVQAVVSKSEKKRLLPDDSAKTLAVAAAMGAASSSCSYAAVLVFRFFRGNARNSVESSGSRVTPLYDAFLRLTISFLDGIRLSNSLMSAGICL